MKKIIFLVFLSFLISSCNSNQEIKETQVFDNNTQTPQQEIVKKEDISGLEKDLEEFNKIYKQALFNTGQDKIEGRGQTETAKEQWEKIYLKYNGKNVLGFENTKNLDEELVLIKNILSKAIDYVAKDNLEFAHEELELVRNEIAKIRQENDIKTIIDDMLFVHNKMEQVIENGLENKDTADIKGLIVSIQKLKEYNTDNEEYKTFVGDFENTVNSLIELTGEEYKAKLLELKPLFIKMYLKFG